MCFDFLFKFYLKHFSFYEELSEILSHMYIGIHVKFPLFLSDFKENWIFLTNFRKTLKYKTLWKSVQWELSCCMRTDGPTNGHTGMMNYESLFAILWKRLQTVCRKITDAQTVTSTEPRPCAVFALQNISCETIFPK